jgi:hypothetical protein
MFDSQTGNLALFFHGDGPDQEKPGRPRESSQDESRLIAPEGKRGREGLPGLPRGARIRKHGSPVRSQQGAWQEPRARRGEPPS